MSVIPAKASITQIDRGTFDFFVSFFEDAAHTIPLDLSGKAIHAALYNSDRTKLIGAFDVSATATANERYFRLQASADPKKLIGTLALDVFFVEADASPEGTRRDYYLQVAVAFKKGNPT